MKSLLSSLFDTRHRGCMAVLPEKNVNDEFLFLPVAAGMWKQHELRDGTCTLDDLPDAAELIQVRNANEARAMGARA